MPQSQAPNPLAMMFPFAIMFLIFYLLVFRPQAQARKAHEQLLKNLKKNDEVVTAGGVLGTVVNVKTQTVVIRVDDNVRLEVEKTAITKVVQSRGPEA